jgi:hypothetical protein
MTRTRTRIVDQVCHNCGMEKNKKGCTIYPVWTVDPRTGWCQQWTPQILPELDKILFSEEHEAE